MKFYGSEIIWVVFKLVNIQYGQIKLLPISQILDSWSNFEAPRPLFRQRSNFGNILFIDKMLMQSDTDRMEEEACVQAGKRHLEK